MEVSREAGLLWRQRSLMNMQLANMLGCGFCALRANRPAEDPFNVRRLVGKWNNSKCAPPSTRQVLIPFIHVGNHNNFHSWVQRAYGMKQILESSNGQV